MKRLIAVLFVMLFLAGCGQTETPVFEAPADEPHSAVTAPETMSESITEAEVPLTPTPEAVPEVEVKPEPKPIPIVKPEPSPEPAPEPEVDENAELAKQAADVYKAITDELTFTVWVEEPDGTVTTLDITPENALNAAGMEHTFEWVYQWSAATAEDWAAQMASEERGYLLTLAAPEEMSIACCSGGDVIKLVNNGAVSYLRAVNPEEGEPFEWKLYGALILIAEDAVSAQVWDVTADGGLTASAAAQQMAAQIAENYRNVPDWVQWKPLDVQPGGVDVYDLYKGDPQQFCCGMGLRVKFGDFQSVNTAYWQAGAGLEEADAEGYYGYGSGVYVMQSEEGDWRYHGRGTGGVFINPPVVWESATIEQLVEVFCLTEGNTHEWFVPNYLLMLPESEMVKLPGVLDQLTEPEVIDLCSTLGRCLREYDYWGWTIDTLKPVLGDFGAYLDA